MTYDSSIDRVNSAFKSKDVIANYDGLIRIINWRGCRRKWLRLNLRHYLSICLKGLNKTAVTSVMIAGLWTEIYSWNLPNEKWENYLLDDSVW
jgi:hypothetical protein